MTALLSAMLAFSLLGDMAPSTAKTAKAPDAPKAPWCAW